MTYPYNYNQEFFFYNAENNPIRSGSESKLTAESALKRLDIVFKKKRIGSQKDDFFFNLFLNHRIEFFKLFFDIRQKFYRVHSKAKRHENMQETMDEFSIYEGKRNAWSPLRKNYLGNPCLLKPKSFIYSRRIR